MLVYLREAADLMNAHEGRVREGENQQAYTRFCALNVQTCYLFFSSLETESLNKGTRVKVLLHSSGKMWMKTGEWEILIRSNNTLGLICQQRRVVTITSNFFCA